MEPRYRPDKFLGPKRGKMGLSVLSWAYPHLSSHRLIQLHHLQAIRAYNSPTYSDQDGAYRQPLTPVAVIGLDGTDSEGVWLGIQPVTHTTKGLSGRLS